MSLNYLCFGSYWRNLTSPLIHWRRGTTVQFDTMKDHPEMQVVVAELGTDVVALTMAARITQSIFSLARNLLNKRPWGWKIITGDWRSKVFQALLWMCWKIIEALLAVEVTNMFVYKNLSKHSTCCHTEESMNTVAIKCHWGCKAELDQQNMIPEKELLIPRMEKLLENADMEEACDHKVFSDMNIMVSKETLLQSCTNPFILSMICVPSEDGDCSPPSEGSELSEFESDGESDSECSLSEESSLSESESGDEEAEKSSSLEASSVDSGLQESWTPKSKEDVDGSEEESDWSDEEGSWDAASDVDDGEEDDLWASFCRNDDPYNPLSFAMPTRSHKQVKKEALNASSEKHQVRESCPSITTHEEPQKSNCTTQSRARKPVLSSFKCSHKCANQKDEPGSIELNHTGNTGVKKVRFSSNVTVHHMITWSYAYRTARKGPWEEYARDRSRFQKRIAETEATISFCLEPHHREKIWAARRCQE